MIFTALLSVAFLGRRIYAHMWIGMFLVVIGLVLVGVADIVFHNATDSAPINNIITGRLKIIQQKILMDIFLKT
jgi:drug/metabolite transporter (DMT)-like permease